MRPNGWQPTRLPRPWDSPGKNTGVGCHFLLQYYFLDLDKQILKFIWKSKGPKIAWIFFLNIETNNKALVIKTAAAAAAKSLQSCLTLCDPIDSSPPGSPVPGILQARTLEWVAISFSNAWKWKVKVKLLSRVQLLATPWTAAHQAPPSMGFSRQEYWSGVPLPSPVIKTALS